MPVARTSPVWLSPSSAATAASTAYWRWVIATGPVSTV